jgi:transcriptional regulator with XRE-family HTH domain
MTMAQVVGSNVGRLRGFKDWSQEMLRVRLAEFGISVSRPTIAQLEAGKRPISVDELLALGLALNVAPHLLLYPPRDTDVVTTKEGGDRFQGFLIADWLWNPDVHPFTKGEAERRWWFDSLDLDRLSEESMKKIEDMVSADEAKQLNRQRRSRKVSRETKQQVVEKAEKEER